jgi:hypothetical protein
MVVDLEIAKTEAPVKAQGNKNLAVRAALLWSTPDLLPRNLIQTKVNFSGYKTVRGEGV